MDLEKSHPVDLNPTITVVWEVTKIVLVRYLYTRPIFSESIPIYDQGISLWRFVLHTVGNHLEFYILRYPSDDDENDPIRIRFRVSLVNQGGEIYFRDASDTLTYSKPSSADGQSFANESNLRNKIKIPKCFFELNCHPLVLRCNIKLSTVHSEETDDYTSDYQSLHDDLLRTVMEDDVADIFLHSDGTDYAFNSFLVKIRLPCFDALVRAYDETLRYVGDERHDKCQVFKNITARHRRPGRHLFAATLAQAIFRMIFKNPCVTFLKTVSLSLDTLQRSFTRGVCTALQSYLHTGYAEVQGQRDVEALSNLARGLQLHDLVYRLEGRPRELHIDTEMVHTEWTYCLTSEHFSDWKKRKYEPIVKKCDISEYPYFREMILTFRIVQPDDLLDIEIRFPGCDEIPIMLLCDLILKSLEGDILAKSISSHFYPEDSPWCPKGVGLKKQDFDTRELCCQLYCYFYSSDKPWCKDYVRFQSYRGEVNVWNVRRFSSELSRIFGNEATSDVVLVAQGQKLEAHILVLSARSTRFNEELRKKRFLGRKSIHLVPGIEYTTLVDLVKYLYTGETDLENSNSVQKLLSAAVMFGVPSLVRICQYFLEHEA